MAKVQVDLNDQEEEVISSLKQTLYPKLSKEKIIKMIVSKVEIKKKEDSNGN